MQRSNWLCILVISSSLRKQSCGSYQLHWQYVTRKIVKYLLPSTRKRTLANINAQVPNTWYIYVLSCLNSKPSTNYYLSLQHLSFKLDFRRSIVSYYLFPNEKIRSVGILSRYWAVTVLLRANVNWGLTQLLRAEHVGATSVSPHCSPWIQIVQMKNRKN